MAQESQGASQRLRADDRFNAAVKPVVLHKRFHFPASWIHVAQALALRQKVHRLCQYARKMREW